jgi:hypothetical protein
LLASVATAFAYAFFLLLGDVKEDDTKFADSPGLSLVQAYAMMLGAFDLRFFADSPYHGIALMLFVAFTLAVMIIMLNALIAIMGDTYDKVKEQEKEWGLLERAKFVDEMEMLMVPASTAGSCGSKLVCVTTDNKPLAGRWWMRMRVLLCTVCSVPIAVDVSQMSFIHVLSRDLHKQQKSYADEHKEALEKEQFDQEKKTRKQAKKMGQQEESQRQQAETQQLRDMVHQLIKQLDDHRRGVQPQEEISIQPDPSGTDTEQATAMCNFLEDVG